MGVLSMGFEHCHRENASHHCLQNFLSHGLRIWMLICCFNSKLPAELNITFESVHSVGGPHDYILNFFLASISETPSPPSDLSVPQLIACWHKYHFWECRFRSPEEDINMTLHLPHDVCAKQFYHWEKSGTKIVPIWKTMQTMTTSKTSKFVTRKKETIIPSSFDGKKLQPPNDNEWTLSGLRGTSLTTAGGNKESEGASQNSTTHFWWGDHKIPWKKIFFGKFWQKNKNLVRRVAEKKISFAKIRTTPPPPRWLMVDPWEN